MDVYSKVISFENCPIVGKNPPILSLVATNPFGTSVYVDIDYTREGTPRIQLVNQLTSEVIVLQDDTDVVADRYSYEFDTTDITSGNYTLQVLFEGQIYSKNLIKIN